MTEPKQQTWNLTEAQWQRLLRRVRANSDVLEDGAYVRLDADPPEMYFYATALNKPVHWRYPFLEMIPESQTVGALIGRAWYAPETGFVHFEVILYAAAQELRANYESGVDDMDYVAYENASEQAVHGTPSDEAWLQAEFKRLVALAA